MAIVVENTWTNTTSGTATSITVTLTGGATDSNTLVAFLAKDDDVATTGPNGWTRVIGGESNNAIYSEIWMKEASGDGDGTTVVWTGDSEEYVASIYEISGSLGIPDYGVGNIYTGVDSAPYFTGLTSANFADSICISAVAVDGDSTPISLDAELTTLSSLQSSGGAGSVGQVAGYMFLDSGGVLPTLNHAIDSSDQWITLAFFLKPASTGITVTLGQALESDTAQLQSFIKTYPALGFSAETDLANTATKVCLVPANQASETDLAQAVNLDKLLHLGLSEETNTSLALQETIKVALGIAPEFDSSFTIVPAFGGNNIPLFAYHYAYHLG